MAKILVIDDDRLVLCAIMTALEQFGHDPHGIDDGLALGQMTDLDSYDAVITDIFMPDQDGLKTILDIKRRCPATPVIAMSGSDFGPTDYLKHARLLGADRVMRKPFSLVDLIANLNLCLDQATCGR